MFVFTFYICVQDFGTLEEIINKLQALIVNLKNKIILAVYHSNKKSI